MTAEPQNIKHYLREVKYLCRYRIVNADQTLGTLSGLVFDPRSLLVTQFLVTPSGRQDDRVAVSVELFRSLDDAKGTFEVELSAEGLRSAEHYRPEMLARPRLIDTSAVIGRAVEGSAGRIDDLLVNVVAWQLRYLVIEIGSRRVLTDIEWCSSFDGGKKHVGIDLPAEAIATAPPYIALDELCRGYEEALYRHYTSRAYMVESDVA